MPLDEGTSRAVLCASVLTLMEHQGVEEVSFPADEILTDPGPYALRLDSTAVPGRWTVSRIPIEDLAPNPLHQGI